MLSAILTIAKYIGPLLSSSLQNLSWGNYQACQNLVAQVEKARQAIGEDPTWQEGHSLLKQIKHYFDWNRNSWWPPDKEKAKHYFRIYVQKLQSKAQAEMKRLQEKASLIVQEVQRQEQRATWLKWAIPAGILGLVFVGIAIWKGNKK